MHAPESYIEGQFLLIDKPLTWTSHDVVNKIRYRLTRYCQVKKLKVGHGGTLDPLATGLLLIATGKNTKMLQDLIDADKEYTGTLKLGATTASYDGETRRKIYSPLIILLKI
jgi:tRNA pseudouridine55 synthase